MALSVRSEAIQAIRAAALFAGLVRNAKFGKSAGGDVEPDHHDTSSGVDVV